MFPPAEVERFDYDREAQAAGIVHFGIGAFHRAHQAWYTDRAMSAGDRDWAITGVSLRSGEVAHQMNPQDGLYTVTERAGDTATTRIVGAVRHVLVAPYEPQDVLAALAAPATRIASLTITEKGYCRAADGSLDPALAGEDSIFAYLRLGLRRRRDAGLPGLTLLSCDNLAENGQQLAGLMHEYLERHDPGLSGWFAAECTCPSSMVDRIVPATTRADRDAVVEALDGLRDEAAVFTEPFSQWVIEDRFAGTRPRWELAGAQFVADIAPFETAKLRMLNGAHSALAYLGLERGHVFVHQAIADPAVRPLVEALMRREAAASFPPAPGQDLPAYADALLARFANPALNHRLAQIAMDGSQKVPQRWLATLAARGAGACPAIVTALGAWLRHLRDGTHVSDPRGEELRALWRAAGAAGIATALFGEAGAIASAWRPTPADLPLLTTAITEPTLGDPT
ncbi:MAG: mannitol dehydrogenase family protein [Sphingomonadales bacterium]|nr:mannitol dehydrogenase family protein [Sphingomonadales bacterium]